MLLFSNNQQSTINHQLPTMITHPNNELDIKNGLLLLADPFMDDHHFRRAVIMICDHHADGTLGFILNKPIGMTVMSLLPDFPEFQSEVHYGGPVQTDTLHFLHNKGDLLDDSAEIVPGVFWGGNFDQLKTFIGKGLIQPSDIRFFIGYSGWTPGQLREELDAASWLMAEGEANYVFYKIPHHTLWQQVLENQGGTYSVIAQMPMPCDN